MYSIHSKLFLRGNSDRKVFLENSVQLYRNAFSY